MQSQTTAVLNLEQVTIRPFSHETVVNRFDCGVAPINNFLKNKAKKAGRRYEHKIFCAHISDSNNVIGYYALQVGSDSVNELPDRNKNNYLKTYVAFPAINLSFLGVASEYHRQGLGSYLLMDAFTKVAKIAECAGFYALTLISYNEKSTQFYKNLNFTIYSENIVQPKMLYPLEDLLSVVRSGS
ncbi:GNAT family N-acetyltransferase [Methylosinus sporium]|uniref:GNAT family N-acetyltransferase n=1 Tax=Methylosinus sporium TaxID=428 RepID=UPI00383BDF81